MRSDLVVVAAVLALAGCKSVDAHTTPTPDDDHPCPDLALTPEGSSRWEDAVANERPVPIALALPLPDDVDVLVTQGNHGTISHSEDQAFAYDFGVAEGTPVFASAPGVVVWVEDDHTLYGPDPSFREEANYVVIDHGGGLFTAYVHLAAGGAEVRPGDAVQAGERLGVTGLSGQMTGPHLHFQVENVWSESLPARFIDPQQGGCGMFPKEGDTVRAAAWARKDLIGRMTLSDIPEDTWRENKVTEVQGLPARLYEHDDRYTVSGHTELEGATEVVMLFLPPEGGTAFEVRRFAVHADHDFSGTLVMRDIAPRAYGIAFVAGTGGPVEVPRSVLTTLIE